MNIWSVRFGELLLQTPLWHFYIPVHMHKSYNPTVAWLQMVPSTHEGWGSAILTPSQSFLFMCIHKLKLQSYYVKDLGVTPTEFLSHLFYPFLLTFCFLIKLWSLASQVSWSFQKSHTVPFLGPCNILAAARNPSLFDLQLTKPGIGSTNLISGMTQ